MAPRLLGSLLVLLGVAQVGCSAPQVELPPNVVLDALPERSRIVLVGDTGAFQEGVDCAADTTESPIPTACREALFASLRSERADAVLALGDLVYEVGPTCVGGELTDEARGVLEDLVGAVQTAADAPLVMVLGNHDLHGSSTGRAAAEACYLSYAAERDGVHLPERNFLVEVGPAVIAVLDTNREPTARLASGISTSLATTPASWTFFAAHHVWKTYDDKEGQDDGPRWAAALERTPSAWLNGHAHFLQFGVYDGVAAVTSGAAGKLRSTTSCGGEHPPCERPGLMFSRSRYGYAVLTVGRDGFEVDFKDITGASLFGWSRTAE